MLRLDIDSITNSPASINLLAAIARAVPPSIGHRISDLIAAGIAGQRQARLTRSVCANQRVVRGEHVTNEELDTATREVLRNAARSIFDLYHHLGNLQGVGALVTLEGEVGKLVQRQEFEQQGLMLLGIHMSSFDLILRWFCLQGIRPMVLTVPEARGGRRREFDMRRQAGMNLVPATVAGLRQARRHLERGGAVLTGIDRPVADARALPAFFGRPAALPIHHVAIAMRANVPMAVVAATLAPDGKYHVEVSEMMMPAGDPRSEADALHNAEIVLRAAETFIRRAPEQWSVPLAVWPSVKAPAAGQEPE